MRWVGYRLLTIFSSATGEEREARYDVSYAWDALSQPYITDQEYKKAVDQTLLTATAMRRDNIVALGPHQVTLIHAMSDAVGVPYSPQQNTVDLLPSPQRKTFFREVYPTIARQIGI